MSSEVHETSLIPVETKNKLTKALEFFHSLKEVKFTNEEEYNNGVELCRSVKSHINQIDSDRKELVKPFNDKVGIINGECNGIIAKLKNAETVIKKGMGDYFQAKERKRIEDQRKLEAEAEEKRRKEAEKARAEAEKAEAYREQGREEMADKAEARAETAASTASTLVAPIVTNSAKVSGTSFKTVYKAEVMDAVTAAQSCLSNDMLKQYVSVDIKGIEKLANAMKGNLKVDGIRIVADTQVSIRK